MNKQISNAMIYQTPQDLGLGALYKDFLQTYGDIEEEQEFARELVKKQERDEECQQEQLKHLRIDLAVGATIIALISLEIWSVLLSIYIKASSS